MFAELNKICMLVYSQVNHEKYVCMSRREIEVSLSLICPQRKNSNLGRNKWLEKNICDQNIQKLWKGEISRILGSFLGKATTTVVVETSLTYAVIDQPVEDLYKMFVSKTFKNSEKKKSARFSLISFRKAAANCCIRNNQIAF